MNQWAKWRKNLHELGGWDNELVAIPAGPVKAMILRGTRQDTDLIVSDELLGRLASYVEGAIAELGGCDHSVGICHCGDIRLAAEVRDFLKQRETTKLGEAT